LINTNIWFTGTTYALTNNFIMTSSGAIQDLTGIGVEFRIGDNVSNLVFYGASSLADASNGLTHCIFTIPSSAPSSIRTMLINIQLTLTNGTTRSTFRGTKQLYVINPLQ
jgi:hypothetical protein